MASKEQENRVAVVVIHGIGEQRPMDTLRGFVDTVLPGPYTSTPDNLSGNLELRRLTASSKEYKKAKEKKQDKAEEKEEEERCVDFFELYWAHLITGTRWGHLLSWLATLFWRNPCNTSALIGIRLLSAILLIVAIGAIILWDLGPEQLEISGAIGLAVLGVFLLLQTIVLNYAGDAARYLHAASRNVGARTQIRQQGIDLLNRLHEEKLKDDKKSQKYDRIFVVGHSLGSVVGYDILKFLWPRMNGCCVRGSQRPHLESVETKSANGTTVNKDGFQVAQHAAWKELKGTGNHWLVSDFVTLGSPLAHAELLLANGRADLEKRKGDRELPSCPPALDGDGRITYDADGTKIPHHGAHFCCTRWTNIYFPSTCIFHGDFIGGPIAPVFGPGVKDVPVRAKRRWGLLTHTCYWGKGHPLSDIVILLLGAVMLLLVAPFWLPCSPWLIVQRIKRGEVKGTKEALRNALQLGAWLQEGEWPKKETPPVN